MARRALRPIVGEGIANGVLMARSGMTVVEVYRSLTLEGI